MLLSRSSPWTSRHSLIDLLHNLGFEGEGEGEDGLPGLIVVPDGQEVELVLQVPDQP